MTQASSIKWETKNVPLFDPSIVDGLEGEPLKFAQRQLDTYGRVELVVRKIKRKDRQAFEREYARILIDDSIRWSKLEIESNGLHPDTMEQLSAYNERVLQACLAQLLGMPSADYEDSASLSPEDAAEELLERNLGGYASQACRSCQSPTVAQLKT